MLWEHQSRGEGNFVGLMSFLLQPPTKPISFTLTSRRHGRDENDKRCGWAALQQMQRLFSYKRKNPQHKEIWTET